MFSTANLCVNGGGLMTRPGLTDRDFLRPGPGAGGPPSNSGPGTAGPGLMHSPFPFLTDGYGGPPRSTPGLLPHNPLPPISTLALPCSVAVTPTSPAGQGLPGLTAPATAAHFPGPTPSLMSMAVNHQQVLEQAFLQELALHAQGFGAYGFGKKLFSCPQCRYITDRKNNLKRHIATMHQECDKALECCGVTFKNKASLRDHVLIFHSNGYMCRFCGRNFCRKALLKRHLTVHSGQKDYTCGLCDYATSHKSNLERHKKVHERPEMEEDGILEVGHEELKGQTQNIDVTSPDDIIDVLTMDEDDNQLSPSSSSSSSSHGSLSDKDEWSEE